MCLVAQKQTKTIANKPLGNTDVVDNAHNHKTVEVYNQLQMNVCTKSLFIG